MAHFTVTIRGYDVIDQVSMMALVHDLDADSSSAEYQFSCHTVFPGSGEGDHREWLRDALVGLLEAL